jgi:hypothetical protein
MSYLALAPGSESAIDASIFIFYFFANLKSFGMHTFHHQNGIKMASQSTSIAPKNPMTKLRLDIPSQPAWTDSPTPLHTARRRGQSIFIESLATPTNETKAKCSDRDAKPPVPPKDPQFLASCAASGAPANRPRSGSGLKKLIHGWGSGKGTSKGGVV